MSAPAHATATEALGTIQLVANVAGGSGMGFGVGALLNVAPTSSARTRSSACRARSNQGAKY